METNDGHETAAGLYDECASELESALRHARAAARHMRDGDVPRACAHGFAALGHMTSSQRLLEDNAILHASHSEA